MSASDYFPTIFSACFALGYCAMAVAIWRGSPERFEKYYSDYRVLAPFPHDVTRGGLRAFAAGALPLIFLALTVAVGDLKNAEKVAGNVPSGFLHQLSLEFIALTFLGWLFQAIVSIFGRPRWLLIPYVRDEKSVWEVRRERRAERRAVRSSSPRNSS